MKTKVMVLFLLLTIIFHFGYRILTFVRPEFTIPGYTGVLRIVLDVLVYGYVLIAIYQRSWKPFLK